jgi:hypothetical protein
MYPILDIFTQHPNGTIPSLHFGESHHSPLLLTNGTKKRNKIHKEKYLESGGGEVAWGRKGNTD